MTKHILLFCGLLGVSAFAKKDWDNWPGKCSKHCTKYKYENPGDIQHKQSLRATLADAVEDLQRRDAELKTSREAFDRAESGKNTAERSYHDHKTATEPLLSSKEKVLAKIDSAERSRKAYMRQVPIVTRLIAASESADFTEALAFYLSRVDASQGSRLVSSCPSFASSAQECQLLKDLLDVVAEEILFWSEINKSIEEVGPVTPALMLYAAAKNKSPEDYEEVASNLSQAIYLKGQSIERLQKEEKDLLAAKDKLDDLHAQLEVARQDLASARISLQAHEARRLTTYERWDKCNSAHENFKIRIEVGESCTEFCT
jgi:hypothetical protein